MIRASNMCWANNYPLIIIIAINTAKLMAIKMAPVILGWMFVVAMMVFIVLRF